MSQNKNKRSTDAARRRSKAQDQRAAEEWQGVPADMLRRTAPLAPWLTGDTSSLPKAPPGKREGGR